MMRSKPTSRLLPSCLRLPLRSVIPPASLVEQGQALLAMAQSPVAECLFPAVDLLSDGASAPARDLVSAEPALLSGPKGLLSLLARLGLSELSGSSLS